MKNYYKIKTLQLFIFAIITIACIAIIFFDSDIFQNVGTNRNILILCLSLWICFGLSFVFIYIDFRYISSYRSDYSELDYAVRTDHVAGIANRYSCDAIIEKYAGKPLPKDMASIMFDITNIQQINKQFGHTKGNDVIRDFSTIIKLASFNLCFVGRNGGNKFLALFEKGSDNSIDTFIQKLDYKIQEYNHENPDCKIEYNYGIAFHENANIQDITELIALSNKRVYED